MRLVSLRSMNSACKLKLVGEQQQKFCLHFSFVEVFSASFFSFLDVINL